MHPPSFEYFRAETPADAVALLGQHPDARVLAGGQSLIPSMNLRLSDPGVIIDIGRIPDWNGISVMADGSVAIGALTPHYAVATSADVPRVMSEAAGMIGDPQVRSRGTIGGNLAHADPASDMPTVVMALEANLEAVSPRGSRMIPALDCFLGLFNTALEADEILATVLLAPRSAGRGSAYVKLANPASRYAMLGVAAWVVAADGVCQAAGVALGGLTPAPVRARSVEAALNGQRLDESIIAAAAGAVGDDLGDELIGDIHASAEYRRAMAPVFVRRALLKAAERAR
ncbi:MAG: FAD binding domain-containing protein [Candidatus Promineifilaceae bacterium]